MSAGSLSSLSIVGEYGPITLRQQRQVGVIVIDNPPVNASSQAVRSGLVSALKAFEENASLSSALMIGANETFIAGSDIREFGAALPEPELPDVIAAVESCEKPVVAAFQGVALGGGFELALGCDARIASVSARVGLPEVTLGMIPGAGGTQRLPRLTGIARAIEIICSGRRIDAREALELGIVDALSDGVFLEQAVSYAAGLTQKRRLIDLPVPDGSTEQVDLAADKAMKSGKQRPPVRAAIDAIRSSTTLPVAEALRAERQVFTRLRTGSEARALRHQFFAERAAGKVAALKGIPYPEMEAVAVIGAGTMGVGIAACFAEAGFKVQLIDQDSEAAKAGLDKLRALYARPLASGKLSQQLVDQCIGRVEAQSGYSRLAEADVIVEAVFEDMTVKEAVFSELGRLSKPSALLASNTSYLDIDQIAAASGCADRVVGMHFFSPAQRMKLLEIVRGTHSRDEALAQSMALAKRLGKISVLAGNAFGFIGNRIFAAWRKQCEFMLEEGALPQDIDAAMRHFGFAMGPFEVADMSGLDIAWRMRKQQAAARDPAARYVEIPDILCEQGRLGRKTGAGYYRYENDGKPKVDPEVTALIETQSRLKGIARRNFSAEDLEKRVLITIVNEAALVLEEGIANKPEDIDVVLVNGYGFPRWQGGPIFWASQQDPDSLIEAQNELEKATGHGFRRGDLNVVLSSQTV